MSSSARRVVIEFLGDDKSASKTARQVDGSTSKLGGRFKKLGVVAAAGFAAAGFAAVKFGGDAIGAASDLNETLNKSEVIFGRQAPAMEKWASTAYKSAGLSKQAALESAAGFGDMFSQLGFAGGAAADMSKQVVQLSADLGSFNNLPTAEVTDMMAGAFRGEYDSLQRVIPNINAARVEHEALAMTGKKTASALTAQEKAAATLAIVQKDGARASGDFARTSGGLANQQKILSAQFENVKASIGQKLLPVMVALANWTTGTLMPALTRFGDWFERVAVPVISRFADKARAKFGELVTYIRDNWSSIKETTRNAIEIVQVLWRSFGKNITTILGASLKNIIQMVKAGFLVLRGVFRVIHGLLTGDWRELWNGIKDILRGAFTAYKSIIRTALVVIREIIKAAWTLVKGITVGAWNGIKAAVVNGAQSIVDGVRAIPGKLKSLGPSFKLAGKILIGQFISGIKNAGGVISGIAGNVWDAVKVMLNGAIDKINSALEFSIDKGPVHVSVNPPDIPHLATGGRIMRGGFAVVGERGPELVDLPSGSTVYSNRESFGRRGGRDGEIARIEVPLYLDGREIQRSLLTLKRVNGNLELGLA